ncbi:MAG TPA: glutaredoxin family protein [Pirellulales bacterium]|nr:glutaredoxin family protein [Pirellulales bacterium]
MLRWFCHEHEVIVYSREGCHLCHEAVEVLARHGLAAREIDIDSQPDLRQRFHEWVPVVVIDGVERFRGRIDEVLLRRLLRSDR